MIYLAVGGQTPSLFFVRFFFFLPNFERKRIRVLHTCSRDFENSLKKSLQNQNKWYIFVLVNENKHKTQRQ